MSDFLAIATVTATLQRALQAAIQADVAGATVSTTRPIEGSGNHLPTVGVNLYLYQISTNPHRSNLDLPTRRANGDLAQRPQIALDLNYLLSFYGDDLSLEPQRVLGSAAAYLHSQPILTRADIEVTISDAAKPFLAPSDLAAQPELVRVTPIPMTLEEISRLWSIMLQTPYVLSVAYCASVVLLERALTPQPALPVRALRLAALPLNEPYVAQVIADAGASVPITPGAAIRIIGQRLQGDSTQALIDAIPVQVTEVAADRVSVTLPGNLNAGPHVAQITQGVRFDVKDASHLAFVSNPGAFVLHPVVTATAAGPDIAVTNVQGAGAAPRSAIVTVGVAPPVAPGQRATLELMKGAQVVGTAFAATLSAPASQLTFPLGGVAAGTYLMRVRIDGAETALQLDGSGAPAGPTGTIT